MAIENNLEPSNSFFSIQDTVEMGSANAKLLDGLLSPETSTANADELETITPKTTSKSTTAKPVQKEKPKEDAEEPKVKSLEEQLLAEDEEEDEEVEKKKPTPKPVKAETEEGEEEDEPETNRFKALSKDLLKLGVFSSEEDEEDLDINTPEQFLERFHNEKKKGAIEIVNNFIGQFGEEYQDAFNAIFSNGVNPREYFTTFNKIENLTELDLSKESNQKAVIKQYLIDQEWDAEDIDQEIERITNYGELEAVATRNHKVLVKKESSKLEQLEQESHKKLEQQKAFKQNYLNNVTTILNNKLKEKEFDGIPLNQSLASEVRDFLVTEKYKTPSGEQLTEFDVAILNLKKPENHEKKVKVGLLLKMLEKDPKLSSIQKTAITKKTNELFSEVQKQQGVKKSAQQRSNNAPVGNSWFSQ